MKAIKNGAIFDGSTILRGKALILDKGYIHDLVDEANIPESVKEIHDLQGNLLASGFIDLQVNGGGGIMFNSEPTKETILKMLQGHAKFGTTGFMPTLITESYDVMEAAVQAVQQAIDDNTPGVLGIHLEGPFLSKVKKGAHDASKFREIDELGFKIVTALKGGSTILTIAPEEFNLNTITELSDAGVIICAGHSNANYQQTVDAIDAGLDGFTHLYNAMTPMQSREPGMVGAAISDEKTWFGIICDGYHMHPSAFKVAVKAKQPGGAVLVTDAMATVGSEKDFFELDGQIIKSVNGKCQNASGSLAGSDLNMNTAIKNAIKFADLSVEEAIRMATLYPAKAINMSDKLGQVKPGYFANLVELNSDLSVCNTWMHGDLI